MERYLELKKCCGEYPRIYSRDGARKVVCLKCNNTTLYYLSAGLSANKSWNEMRDKQVNLLRIVVED